MTEKNKFPNASFKKTVVFSWKVKTVSISKKLWLELD